MTAPHVVDDPSDAAYRRRLEDRRHRELTDARAKVTQARKLLERREAELAAVEAYWAARA